MPHEIPPRWTERVRQHILQTSGEDRGHLPAHDFGVRRSVRLAFPDGSFAWFRYAFHRWGPVRFEPWPLLLGCALVYAGKLWFPDRMVWLYEDMKDRHAEYRSWLY